MARINNNQALENLIDEPTTDIRLTTPSTLIDLVDEFQAAYRRRYDRKISRSSAVLKMLLLGASEAYNQVDEWNAEAGELEYKSSENAND